ncbi:hypothetical protein [Telmatospirillum siberiense]|uniref:hypothetical protein n=1 Tax=Telmatospirillum siberiense TaxID=382514 RepID=UPI00130457E6|nr:hypothetical protein [Telmatospirillum siberiense]
MTDLADIVVPADLLRQMRLLLLRISVEAARLNAPEVILHCQKSDKIVSDLLRRQTM